MNLQNLEELQKNLLRSDLNLGGTFPFLNDMRSSRFVDWEYNEIQQPEEVEEYLEKLGNAYLLTNLLIEGYEGMEQDFPKYSKKDEHLLKLYGGMRRDLRTLAEQAIADYPNKQTEELQDMVANPRNYDDRGNCPEAMETLTSLANFRHNYPIPFSELHPEIAKNIFEIYQDVVQGSSEKNRWLEWVNEDFAEAFISSQKRLPKKNGKTEAAYRQLAALARVLNTDPANPYAVARVSNRAELPRVAIDCERFVNNLYNNMWDDNVLPVLSAEQLQAEIDLLQTPRQQALPLGLRLQPNKTDGPPANIITPKDRSQSKEVGEMGSK